VATIPFPVGAVGRDEKQAPLKTPAWEAKVQAAQEKLSKVIRVHSYM